LALFSLNLTSHLIEMPHYVMGVLTQSYAAQTSLFEFTCMLHNNVERNPWTNNLGCLLMSVTNTRVELIRFSWSYSSTAWTFPLKHPQKKKSGDFWSGECGGQTTERPQPIHVFWKRLSNQMCIWCEKGITTVMLKPHVLMNIWEYILL
jgi:hypothetical protein